MKKLEFEIRHGDYPEYKERVVSQLFGEFVGFCRAKGLTKGEEYETRVTEIFQCSKKILWLDQWNPDFQITVFADSYAFYIGFGVATKKNGKVTKDVIHRHELKDLRYKISSCTDVELIDAHEKKFNAMFQDFKEQFAKYENYVNV